MAEIRKYKLSVEEIKEELSSVNETIGSLRQERDDLQSKSRALKKTLSSTEDRNRILTQNLTDRQEELDRTKVGQFSNP